MIEVIAKNIKTASLILGTFEFEIAANCDSHDHPFSHEIAVEFNCKLIPYSQFFITIVVPDDNKKHLELQMTYPSEQDPKVVTHETILVDTYQELCDCVAMIVRLLERIYGKAHKELKEFDSPHLAIVHKLFFENIGFRGIGNEPH